MTFYKHMQTNRPLLMRRQRNGKMIQKIKANWVFSADLKSLIKSIWIGPLLITWTHEGYPVSGWYETIEFSWYGWDYWQPQEIEWKAQNETD